MIQTTLRCAVAISPNTKVCFYSSILALPPGGTNLASAFNFQLRYTLVLLFVLFVILLISYTGIWKYARKTMKKPETKTQREKKKSTTERTITELQKEIRKKETEKFFLNPNIQLLALSRLLSSNPSYVRLAIRKMYNCSFPDYINGLRVDWLCKELESNPSYRAYKMEFLAQESGFGSAKSLLRAFRKHKGMTPSEFVMTIN